LLNHGVCVGDFLCPLSTIRPTQELRVMRCLCEHADIIWGNDNSATFIKYLSDRATCE
jgi:hypothetical protein